MFITDDIQAKKEIAKTLLWELGLGFRVGLTRGTVKAELFRQMVYPRSTCQDWTTITWNMICIHFGQSIKPCRICKFCFMLLVYNCGHMVSNLLWNCECRTRHPNPLLPLIQESNSGVGVGARSIQIFPSFLTFSLAWMQGSICIDSLPCNLEYVLLVKILLFVWSALQNAVAKAKRVLTETKADIKANFGRPSALDSTTRLSGRFHQSEPLSIDACFRNSLSYSNSNLFNHCDYLLIDIWAFCFPPSLFAFSLIFINITLIELIVLYGLYGIKDFDHCSWSTSLRADWH